MMDWYFKTHPRIQRWQHRFTSRARRDDYIEDIFSGRRRYFYGSVTATEAVNFPVQSCGSYLMDTAMLEAAPRFAALGGHILMNWHDAMVVEVPTEHRNEGALILKETMTKTLEYEGHKMRYSVDIEAGSGLGEMEEISV
jgi:DNA polymerase I-like protein with 3'-5' exonuclease and polymerase domains